MNRIYYIADDALENIANAIREKTGSTSRMTPFQMAETIRNELNIDSNQIIDGTISYIHDSRASTIAPYRCYEFNELHTGIFENAASIGTYAFYSCEKLANIYAPKAVSVGGNAFANCMSLVNVDLGITATLASNDTVGTYLRNNQNLKSVTFPECPTIGNEALAYCYNLSYASFPKATTIGTWCFRNNSAMSYAEFPAATVVSTGAFYSCKALEELYLPACTTVNGSRAFEQMPALRILDLPLCSSFHASGCLAETNAALTSVRIGFSTTVSNAFANKPALKYFEASNGITLATNCLASCTALTSISFPVATTIGQTAFQQDAKLSSFTFPKVTTIGASAFLSCQGITIINNNFFPQSTVIVGATAFQNCVNLSKVQLSCGGVSLNAFAGCTNLKEINLTVPSLTVASAMSSIPITKLTLRGCSTVTSYTFRSCHNLQSLYTVGPTDFNLTGTFENCSALKTISMPGCTRMSYATFKNCWELSSVYLPAVTTMGRECFAFCSNLTTVDLPALTTFYYSTTTSQMAFYSCPKLENVRLGGITGAMSSMLLQGQTTIKYVKLDNASQINNNALNGCINLETIIAPKCGLVGQTTFYNCSKLNNVNLPACQTIYKLAFQNCIGLTNISIPAVTLVSSQAFQGCTGLSQITIPSTLPTIAVSTFSGCTNLMSIRLEGDTLKTLAGTNAFTNTPISISTLTGTFGSIYVPSALYASYIAATNWKTYSARFVSY